MRDLYRIRSECAASDVRAQFVEKVVCRRVAIRQ